MTDLERLLPDAFAGLADQAPHRADLALAVRRRARRGAVLAAAAVVAVTAAGTGLAVARRDTGTGPAAVTCRAPETTVLPEWARTGFSGDAPVATFARSTDGDLVAVLFRQPLTSPPPQDGANKVLWIPRVPLGPDGAITRARLGGTGPAVPVDVPAGLGPSSVDLPSPGCWRVEVSWAGRIRTVDLEVAAGEPAASDPPPEAVRQAVRSAAAGPGARPDPAVRWVLTTPAGAPVVYLVQLTGRFEADGEPPAGALLLEVPDPGGPVSGVVVRRLAAPVDLSARGTVHRYTPFR